MISFYFYHHYFHTQYNYYSKNYFLLIKKCSDISVFVFFCFLLNYFFISLLFFLSSFSFSVSKIVQILIISSFNLSVINFGFSPISACLINFSFFTSCSSSFSISSLEKIIMSVFFSQYIHSYSLVFHSYIFTKISWKFYENKKYCI